MTSSLCSSACGGCRSRFSCCPSRQANQMTHISKYWVRNYCDVPFIASFTADMTQGRPVCSSWPPCEGSACTRAHIPRGERPLLLLGGRDHSWRHVLTFPDLSSLPVDIGSHLLRLQSLRSLSYRGGHGALCGGAGPGHGCGNATLHVLVSDVM